MNKLRIAAISFLNPAPLLFHFEHSPHKERLAERYDVHYTLPSQCASQLASGVSDLGLIPIAAMPTIPGIVAVPGCTVASLDRVRSIQLVVRPGVALEAIRTVAADAASRSSTAYLRMLLQHFYGVAPEFDEQEADLATMLAHHDAALLIGDPALLALEQKPDRFQDHTWIDLAQMWHKHTKLPWVAAVWAVRTEALVTTGITAQQLTHDLLQSRDAGLEHIDQIVAEWEPRLPLSAETIRQYLTGNIRYMLDAECLRAIDYFFELGEKTGVLPHYRLRMLPTR